MWLTSKGSVTLIAAKSKSFDDVDIPINPYIYIYIYIFPHTDKKVTKERDRKSVNLKLAHQGDGGYLEAFVLIVLAWIIFLGYPCKVNQ
jgi:hypothetical protein